MCQVTVTTFHHAPLERIHRSLARLKQTVRFEGPGLFCGRLLCRNRMSFMSMAIGRNGLDADNRTALDAHVRFEVIGPSNQSPLGVRPSRAADDAGRLRAGRRVVADDYGVSYVPAPRYCFWARGTRMPCP